MRQACLHIGQPCLWSGQPCSWSGQPCPWFGQPCPRIWQLYPHIWQPCPRIGQPCPHSWQSCPRIYNLAWELVINRASRPLTFLNKEVFKKFNLYFNDVDNDKTHLFCILRFVMFLNWILFRYWYWYWYKFIVIQSCTKLQKIQ